MLNALSADWARLQARDKAQRWTGLEVGSRAAFGPSHGNKDEIRRTAIDEFWKRERVTMMKNALVSRRAALASLATSSLLVGTSPVFATSDADAYLLALGRDFDAASAKLDSVLANERDPPWRLLDELTHLDTEIVATQAVTMEGLCVKARAACWALLGDIDPEGQATTDKRMALSIVRDLIRLFAPNLEQPGTLTRLLDDIERDACSPTADVVERGQ